MGQVVVSAESRRMIGSFSSISLSVDCVLMHVTVIIAAGKSRFGIV